MSTTENQVRCFFDFTCRTPYQRNIIRVIMFCEMIISAMTPSIFVMNRINSFQAEFKLFFCGTRSFRECRQSGKFYRPFDNIFKRIAIIPSIRKIYKSFNIITFKRHHTALSTVKEIRYSEIRLEVHISPSQCYGSFWCYKSH